MDGMNVQENFVVVSVEKKKKKKKKERQNSFINLTAHVFTCHLSSSSLLLLSSSLFSLLLFFSAGTELDLMGWGGPVPRKMRLINVNDWINENVIPMTTHGEKRPEWYYRRYASQR